jgi:hypothetical protein
VFEARGTSAQGGGDRATASASCGLRPPCRAPTIRPSLCGRGPETPPPDQVRVARLPWEASAVWCGARAHGCARRPGASRTRRDARLGRLEPAILVPFGCDFLLSCAPLARLQPLRPHWLSPRPRARLAENARLRVAAAAALPSPRGCDALLRSRVSWDSSRSCMRRETATQRWQLSGNGVAALPRVVAARGPRWMRWCWHLRTEIKWRDPALRATPFARRMPRVSRPGCEFAASALCAGRGGA